MQTTEKFSIQCEHCKKWTDTEGTASMERVMRAIDERCSHCSKDYGWNARIRGEGASLFGGIANDREKNLKAIKTVKKPKGLISLEDAFENMAPQLLKDVEGIEEE